jgi:hypothetical protein
MGLRRGFQQAGAQNLLMTLWRVSDADAIARFMPDLKDLLAFNWFTLCKNPWAARKGSKTAFVVKTGNRLFLAEVSMEKRSCYHAKL